MRVLLTGATGYIGKRLLTRLLLQGHQVVCLVRDRKRFNPPSQFREMIEVVEGDLLDPESLSSIHTQVNAAYYLVHSMTSSRDYESSEVACARNFRTMVERLSVKQVIYLSGIINSDELSKHLKSRMRVEEELSKGSYHTTTLRAGIIIGSGSASFEIIRDLVEKLPVMIAPRWLNTRCQPIGISDVLKFLTGVLNDSYAYDRSFDIGGPDILTYKEMLLKFAEERKLKRHIGIVPVMTPRLSSYWLYFVTSTSYNLAIALVNSMKVEVVCEPNGLADHLGIEPISYAEALSKAFAKIERNEIVSSWKDAQSSGVLEFSISEFVQIPEHGCFRDVRKEKVVDRAKTIDKIWQIGGDQGWYSASVLWGIRGLMDKIVGGVGLRRGRTSSTKLEAGDAVDFWRVLYADRGEGRLILLAEMKLPGEAWLEFNCGQETLTQTATFRPKGLLGRLYWYAVKPFHGLVFSSMIKNLVSDK